MAVLVCVCVCQIDPHVVHQNAYIFATTETTEKFTAKLDLSVFFSVSFFFLANIRKRMIHKTVDRLYRKTTYIFMTGSEKENTLSSLEIRVLVAAEVSKPLHKIIVYGPAVVCNSPFCCFFRRFGDSSFYIFLPSFPLPIITMLTQVLRGIFALSDSEENSQIVA